MPKQTPEEYMIKRPVRHPGGGVVVDADGKQLLVIDDWRVRDEIIVALNAPARDAARDAEIAAEAVRVERKRECLHEWYGTMSTDGTGNMSCRKCGNPMPSSTMTARP